MKFKNGEIIFDSRGRMGVIISSFNTIAGIFYNIIFDGKLESMPEEELSEKKK